MENTDALNGQVLGNSYIFTVPHDPQRKHIIPLELREVVERAWRGESPSEIYLDLRKAKRAVRLSEIQWVFEKVKPGPVTGETPPAVDFKKNWYHHSLFEFRLLPDLPFVRLPWMAWVLVALMIAASLTGPGGLFRLYEYAGFLQWHGDYHGSLWVLILALSGLGVGKGIFRWLLAGFITGRLPESNLVFRGYMFDLMAGSVRLEASANRTERLLFWIGSAYGFLATAAVVSWFLPAEQVRDVRLLGLFLTLVSVNPSRRGEISKIFEVLFPDTVKRRFVPFLKNRSLLLMMSGEKKQEDEDRLILYSTVSLIWVFCFIFVAQNILNSNFAEWALRLMTAAPGEKLTVSLIVCLLAVILGVLLWDLFRTVARNLMFPWLDRRHQAERSRKVTEVSSYNAEKLIPFLSRLPFFEGLANEELESLCKKGQVRRVPAGTRLVIRGDEGRELFVLLEGEAEVLRADPSGFEDHVATLSPGALFGEIALLREVHRSSDVRAVSDALVFVLDKNEFEDLIRGRAGASTLEQRVALSLFFADCPLFKNLPPETLNLFVAEGDFQTVPSGQTILKEGEPISSFYLLVRGKVRVESKGQAREELTTGGFFGEIALFEHESSGVTVQAVEETLLLRIASEAFWRVADQNLRMAVDLESVSQSRAEAYA